MSESDQERRFLIRRPKALQYFHKGQLYKASEKERVAGRFELFLDLLYVALIANFADDLSEHATGENLVKYLLTFTPAWHAWADAKELSNNYYNDDLLQRVLILWIMALLVIYANNANLVADDIGALRTTVGAYIVIRLTQVSVYFVYSFSSHFHRTQNRCYFAGCIVGMCIWIPLFFESVSLRAKIAVTVVALVWEELCYLLTFGPWIARLLKLDFTTAVDIEHENDRYTAFTIIVLGEFTYGIIVGSPAAIGLNFATLRAVWTLVIAFCFNSMYTNNDGSLQSVHPIRRSVWSSFAWLLVHLPISAGLLIGGHVSASSVAGSEEAHHGLTPAQRWLWGGGLGAGMAGMWILAMLYKGLDTKGQLYMTKQMRIAPRLAVALIFALLPLVDEEQLSTTSLISIGAGMTAFVVIWEAVGALDRTACWFEDWTAPLEELRHVTTGDHI